MKLKSKLLIFLLSTIVSIPTFAVVRMEDTFSYENINDTLVGVTTAGGNSKYIIAADNTIMGCGTDVAGINSSTTNTNGTWQQIVTGANGECLSDIVKIYRNRVYLYAIDKDGNAYYISGYPKKITIPDEPDVKFKDVGTSYYSYGNSYMSFLISEDGNVYKGNAGTFTKLDDITNAKSIYTSYNAKSGSYDTSACVILDKNGQAYYATRDGKVTRIEGVTDVTDVYGGHLGFYFKFRSGRIGYASNFGNAITKLNIPEGEIFLNMFGTDKTVIGLFTDKNVYQVTGATLKEAKINWNNEDDNSNRRIVYSHGDLAVDNYGKYYTWSFASSTFNMTPIDDINWSNENPIASQDELGNFDIQLNGVYKREDTYDFTFNLVAQEQPKKFNFYYVKSSDRDNKQKWIKIEDNVDVETLDKISYDTTYINKDGEPILGFSYTYRWEIGNKELVGINLIVEPVYE